MDFGSCALKAVAIKPGAGKTFNILQTHYFPVKPEDSEEQKELSRLSYLKSLIDLYQDREVKYIFCCPQNEISVHTLHFPFKEPYKIKKSLPFEIENKLALFNKESLISDIKIINTQEDKTRVLVFSSFKKNIVKLNQSLQALKIQPFIVTCEASAVSNLFEQKSVLSPAVKKAEEKPKQQKKESGKQAKECQLYVKIGHTHTMVLVFSQGFMENVYSFEWGAEACVRQIAVKYEVPYAKAMQQFCNKAFVLTQSRGYTGSQIEFSKTIEEPLSVLVHKIRLLILELQGEKKYKCKKIFLMGGGAQIRNLQAFLFKELNLPALRVENPIGSPDWDLRSNDHRQNNLITALGTALEGLKTPRNPAINFLKGDLAVKMNPLKALPAGWRKNLPLIAASLVCLNCYSIMKEKQSGRLSDKAQKTFRRESIRTAKLPAKSISIEKVRKFMAGRKKTLKQKELIRELNYKPSALDRIKDLSSAVKKNEQWGMTIKQLKINSDKIKITGEIKAPYQQQLEKQLRTLAENKTFKDHSKEKTQSGTAAVQDKEVKPDSVAGQSAGGAEKQSATEQSASAEKQSVARQNVAKLNNIEQKMAKQSVAGQSVAEPNNAEQKQSVAGKNNTEQKQNAGVEKQTVAGQSAVGQNAGVEKQTVAGQSAVKQNNSSKTFFSYSFNYKQKR